MFKQWSTAAIEAAIAKITEEMDRGETLNATWLLTRLQAAQWLQEELASRHRGPQRVKLEEEKRYANE